MTSEDAAVQEEEPCASECSRSFENEAPPPEHLAGGSEEDLYFEREGEILRAELPIDGELEGEVVGSPSTPITTLAANGNDLYFGHEAGIDALDPPAHLSNIVPQELLASEDALFLRAPNNDLLKIELATQTEHLLATNISTLEGLSADHVYFSIDTALLRVPKRGGDAQTVFAHSAHFGAALGDRLITWRFDPHDDIVAISDSELDGSNPSKAIFAQGLGGVLYFWAGSSELYVFGPKRTFALAR